jgi:hypothetical protein
MPRKYQQIYKEAISEYNDDLETSRIYEEVRYFGMSEWLEVALYNSNSKNERKFHIQCEKFMRAREHHSMNRIFFEKTLLPDCIKQVYEYSRMDDVDDRLYITRCPDTFKLIR